MQPTHMVGETDAKRPQSVASLPAGTPSSVTLNFALVYPHPNEPGQWWVWNSVANTWHVIEIWGDEADPKKWMATIHGDRWNLDALMFHHPGMFTTWIKVQLPTPLNAERSDGG